VTVDGEMSCGSQARYVHWLSRLPHPGQVYKTREQTSALTLHIEQGKGEGHHCCIQEEGKAITHRCHG